jgi:hypothetical protein
MVFLKGSRRKGKSSAKLPRGMDLSGILPSKSSLPFLY